MYLLSDSECHQYCIKHCKHYSLEQLCLFSPWGFKLIFELRFKNILKQFIGHTHSGWGYARV